VNASAIVRTKDSAQSLERVLHLLRAQTVPVEVIVVDSGSTDSTLEIARRHCDRLVEMPAAEFSFGRALNLGAEAATAPILFALSSHVSSVPTDWVERSLAHYERPEVAGTGGYREPGPHGRTGIVLQDFELLRADPFWGYSNTAGSWRTATWQEFRFDEVLDAAEDREWSWRVLQEGWAIAMDPALAVSSDHRMAHGVRHLYRRERRESRVIAQFATGATFPARRALRQWWDVGPSDGRSALRRRGSPWNVAWVLGRYTGVRAARRR